MRTKFCQLISFAFKLAMERVLRKATGRLGYKEMKPEQEKLVKEFISGRDVFGILPTGFGKSLPLVFDELLGTENKSIVVVVTPLKAIMHDQVSLKLTWYAWVFKL